MPSSATLEGLALIVFAISAALFVHHHLLYPILLRLLGARARRARAEKPTAPEGFEPPAVTVIVPAFNEEAVIAEKIRNLAATEYAEGRLAVRVALDGCTDATEARARAALEAAGSPDWITIDAAPKNEGKMRVLNREMARAETPLIALSDASSLWEPDALRRAVAHFADPEIGVVCPSYRLPEGSDPGEAAYWRYQRAVRIDEAAIAAPMGAHGALYLFRRALASPLPPLTINDDFVLPMRIVADGARAVYDADIVAHEGEKTRPGQDYRRRKRIGAGNMQQLLWLWRLGDPRRPALAFVFLSGKGLRPLIPFLMIAGALASLYLAAAGSTLFQVLSGLGLAATGAALLASNGIAFGGLRPLRLAGYFIEGYWASMVGALNYLFRTDFNAWAASTRARRAGLIDEGIYVPLSVRASKRAIDIALSGGVLLVFGAMLPFLAAAIKLNSSGPVFYKQLRVGRSNAQKTKLFYLYKLRTMYQDAERRTGAVWASKNDPRITSVGLFLRKTRLDELPQAWNVLRGDMSFIGPRPERPTFFPMLESEIPFYAERIYGVKPGLTGLAQVSQGYDESIEDVKSKVAYDHAYAMKLTRWSDWLRTDLQILLRTVRVVVLKMGQ